MRREYFYLILLIGLAIAMRSITLGLHQVLDGQTIGAVYAMIHGTPFAEEGLVMAVTIPSHLLGGAVSVFAIMYAERLLLTIVACIAVYLLGKRISNSSHAALLGTFLYATSQIGMWRESLNIWVGDGFTPILLILAVLFLLYWLDGFEAACDPIYALGRRLLLIPSLFLLALAYFIWNGGPYALWAYGLVAGILFLRNFIKSPFRLLFIAAGVTVIMGAVFVSLPAFTLLRDGIAPTSSFRAIVQFATQTEFHLEQNNPFYLAYLQGHDLVFGIWLCLSSIVTALACIGAMRFNYRHRAPEAQNTYLAVILSVVAGLPFVFFGPRWNSLVYIPIAILAGSALSFLSPRKRLAMYVCLVILTEMVVLSVSFLPIWPGACITNVQLLPFC